MGQADRTPTSIGKLGFYREEQQNYQSLIPLFANYSDEDIWAAIEAKRAGGGSKLPPEDLKLPEWQVFSNPDSAAENRDFKLKRVAPPKGFESVLRGHSPGRTHP